MPAHDDRMCFSCGTHNPHGLQLNHRVVSKGQLAVHYTVQPHHVGWVDHLHGGIVSSIFDHLVGKTAVEMGLYATTARLEVRLRKPVRVGETLTFTSSLVRRAKTLLFIECRAENKDGACVASCSGTLFIHQGSSVDPYRPPSDAPAVGKTSLDP